MGKVSRVRPVVLLGWAALSIAASGRAAPPSATRCEMKAIAQLPVTMADRRALVKARVDGVEMAFLADSGAIFSMMTPASATRLGLARRPGPKGFSMSGVGGAIAIELATVKRFELAGRTLADVNFLIGGGEAGADGLLGQNVLGIADVEYDLGGGMIRLLEPSGCTERNLADWAGGKPVSAIDIEPLTAGQRHITGTATLNGVPLKVVFDTGAPTTLVSLAAARRAGIKPGDTGVLPAGNASGLGGVITQSWIAPAARYRLGGREIGGDPLRIADIGGVPFDLLIGADFFLSHRVFAAYAQHRLYFVDMTNQPGQPLPALADADGYGRRGAALAARRDLDNAIADFTRAIELSPNEPHYLVQRATARLDKDQRLLARHDLDMAVARKPGLVEALLTRSIMHFEDKNFASARQDLDAAAKSAAGEADERFTFGAVYAGFDDWRRSVEEFNLWIAAHPGDYRQGAALNARCWAGAMLGEALQGWLDDCNAALRLQPNEFAFFDSRALVELRMGQLDKAIADYDAALARQPDIAWSFFGRGLAKIRKGREKEGRADLAMAIQLQPDLAQRAAAIGLITSATEPR